MWWTMTWRYKEVNHGYMQKHEAQVRDLLYMKYKNRQMTEIKARPSGMRGGAVGTQHDEASRGGGSVFCYLYLCVSYMSVTNWAI